WREMKWYDQYSGRAYQIGVGRECPVDRVQVKSYRDALLEYRVHPEPKSLGPDGQPCHRATTGLLSRRPVRAGARLYIGKESNRLEDVVDGLVHRMGNVRATYRDARDQVWERDIVPLLKRLPRALVARRAHVTGRIRVTE